MEFALQSFSGFIQSVRVQQCLLTIVCTTTGQQQQLQIKVFFTSSSYVFSLALSFLNYFLFPFFLSWTLVPSSLGGLVAETLVSCIEAPYSIISCYIKSSLLYCGINATSLTAIYLAMENYQVITVVKLSELKYLSSSRLQPQLPLHEKSLLMVLINIVCRELHMQPL